MSRSRDKLPWPLLLLVGFFGLLVLGLPLVFWYRLEYLEVCPQCARVRDCQDWLIPFSRTSYYTHREVQDTALTTQLVAWQYVDAHAHQWLLVRGVGPGSHEITGEGVRVAPALITPAIAPFVERLHEFTDAATEAYWFARMTHPHHADFVRNVADRCARERFADAGTFRDRLRQIASEERRLMLDRLGRVHEPETRTPPRLLYQRPPR